MSSSKRGYFRILTDHERKPRKRASLSNRLLKNSQNVIARSVFCDVAISNLLISLKPRLLRFARKDGLKLATQADRVRNDGMKKRGLMQIRPFGLTASALPAQGRSEVSPRRRGRVRRQASPGFSPRSRGGHPSCGARGGRRCRPKRSQPKKKT